MELWGPFIGPCMAWATRRTLCGCQVCLAHIVWLPVSVDRVNINRLTFDLKKKKKKTRVSCPVPWTKSENFFGPFAAAQPCQVKLVSIQERRNFEATKCGIMFSIQHLSLQSGCQIKKGQLWIPYFLYPWFACWTPKIPKILSFLHGATKTSRLTWCNLFRHQSTRNAFSGQIDQNALVNPR